MTSLAVPTPQLHWDAPGPMAEIESPVKVSLGAIAYDDGIAPSPNDVQKVGAFVYRTALGAEEIWNETDQTWQPPPSDAAGLVSLAPLPLAFQANKTPPWQGVLMAVGTDAAGAPRYAKAAGGVPRYRLRAWAQTRRDSASFTALSSPSADLQFVSAADNQRFAVELDTGSVRTAERVTILLKNAALQKVGSVEIRAAGSNEVTISNLDDSGNPLARVLLSASGDIHLEPRVGGSVIVVGRLQANLVMYQPGGTGPFVTL